MEQYSYQQQVIVEPAKEKKPVGLQITALVIGIVGFALAFVSYFGAIFSNVGIAIAASEYGYTSGVSTASGIAIIANIVIGLLCLVGLILGVVGLVKSIRRATRTVGGIVMSGIGIMLSESGFILTVIGMIIGGVFRLLIANGVFH